MYNRQLTEERPLQEQVSPSLSMSHSSFSHPISGQMGFMVTGQTTILSNTINQSVLPEWKLFVYCSSFPQIAEADSVKAALQLAGKRKPYCMSSKDLSGAHVATLSSKSGFICTENLNNVTERSSSPHVFLQFDQFVSAAFQKPSIPLPPRTRSHSRTLMT